LSETFASFCRRLYFNNIDAELIDIVNESGEVKYMKWDPESVACKGRLDIGVVDDMEVVKVVVPSDYGPTVAEIFGKTLGGKDVYEVIAFTYIRVVFPKEVEEEAGETAEEILSNVEAEKIAPVFDEYRKNMGCNIENCPILADECNAEALAKAVATVLTRKEEESETKEEVEKK